MENSRLTFSRVLLSRLFIWLYAGVIDISFLLFTKRYYEVSSYFSFSTLPFLLTYGSIASISTLGAWLVYYPVMRRISKEVDQDKALAWDFVLIFLVVFGFRINEVFLPSLYDPKSIVSNIGILLIAGLIWFWFARIGVKDRLFKSLKGLLIVTCIILILYPGGSITDFLNSTSRNGNLKVKPGTPNIVLVTLDTVRADHLGCYGYSRDTSPNIDEFADESIVFTSCRTPMPLTAPAHASLFTGEMPNIHGIFTNISKIPKITGRFRTLAEDLSLAGYQTAGFPSAVHMGRQFGFDKGFETYNENTVISGPEWLQGVYEIAPFGIAGRLGLFKQTYLARNSSQVNQAFEHWMNSTDKYKSAKPSLVWLHYFDAHAPYQPPEDYWKQFDPDYKGNITGSQEELQAINDQIQRTDGGNILPDGFSQADIDNLVARYDGEIFNLDRSFGQLIATLKQHNSWWENTVVIVVSDHGEGLYDDGYFGHNYTLKEDEIRVSCIIKGPGISYPEDQPLSLTDISAYVRNIAGVEPVPGRIIGGMDSEQKGNDDPFTSMVFLKSHAWIGGPYKLIRTRLGNGSGIEYSLYNFVNDPKEKVDIFNVDDPVSQSMRENLQKWIETNKADFPDLLKNESTRQEIDPETLEMLRSLGYIY
jgi:arylsulfatase A-like enzyme